MKEVDISMVRDILQACIDSVEDLDILDKKSDNELMQTNLCEEFSFDSLDLIDMQAQLYRMYHIDLDDNATDHVSLMKNPTVKNFIKMCNEYQVEEPLE